VREVIVEILGDGRVWELLFFLGMAGVIRSLWRKRRPGVTRPQLRAQWNQVAAAHGLEQIERVGGAYARWRAHANVVGLIDGQRLRAHTESRERVGNESGYVATSVELDLRPLLSPSVCLTRIRRAPWAAPAGTGLEDVFSVTHVVGRDLELLQDPGATQALIDMIGIGEPVIEGGVLRFEIPRPLDGSELEGLLNSMRDLVAAVRGASSGKVALWEV